MRICRGLGVAVVCLLLVGLAQAMKTNSLSREGNAVNPLIVQYIPTFKVGTNDLSRALDNQYKTINISIIKTAYVELHEASASLQYVGTSKDVKNLSSLKVHVAKDSFKLTMSFTARVYHIIGGKNYTCETTIPEIFINYTKQVDFETGNTVIEDFENSFSSKLFTSAVCKEKEAAKDKTRIDEAITATEGTSVFIELKKIFDGMKGVFSENTKDEHLSQTYPTNPYVYDYYNYKINVSVSTVQANKFNENGVENQIAGTISTTTHVAVPAPAYEPGYNAFYSIEFIRNMIEYSKSNYDKWQNIKLTRDNMRTKSFKFRLVDLESIVPTVLQKYPKNYLSDVQIICSIKQVGDSNLDQKYFVQRVLWHCEGGFEVTPGNRVVVLDFIPDIEYSLKIFTNTNVLNVYAQKVNLIDITFNQIAEHKIEDPLLAGEYLNEGIFEFKGYTIGTYFKANCLNNLIKLVPGVGLWVG